MPTRQPYSPAKQLDQRAEDMHDLSWKPGHHNYYAFAEGIAFATWILRNQQYKHVPTEVIYSIYINGGTK